MVMEVRIRHTHTMVYELTDAVRRHRFENGNYSEPIQEISSYVGYPDNNYFVKVFKAQYGLTPSEYRSAK